MKRIFIFVGIALVFFYPISALASDLDCHEEEGILYCHSVSGGYDLIGDDAFCGGNCFISDLEISDNLYLSGDGKVVLKNVTTGRDSGSGGLFAPDNVTVDIFGTPGGQITTRIPQVEILDHAIVNLFGGEYFGEISVENEYPNGENGEIIPQFGILNIYGHDLKWDTGAYGLGQTVTGFWGDGAPINIDFISGDRVNLINVVPEPATMFLFGAGLLGLVGFGRKKFKK